MKDGCLMPFQELIQRSQRIVPLMTTGLVELIDKKPGLAKSSSIRASNTFPVHVLLQYCALPPNAAPVCAFSTATL